MSRHFVVSIDFELRWGVYDVIGDDASAYAKNLAGVEEVIPRLLETFVARDVHATWATVGAVACSGWDEWVERAPPSPMYADLRLRTDRRFERLDPKGRVHFAPHLVDAIHRTAGQELASHTFGHVCLREPGVTHDDAVADTDAMKSLFVARWGAAPASIVFPRNQVAFLDVLTARGIRAWRDNPLPRYWRRTAGAEQSRRTRLLRLADSLLPLGTRKAPTAAQRASYFVRVGLPDPLWRAHRRRIRADAKKLRDGESIHLWWHPHNLGAEPVRSVARIAGLLDELREIQPLARFSSMTEIANVSPVPAPE